MPNAKRVIIDCDPGIDDTAALFMGLGSSEIQIEALTTVFGNSSIENCTLNALRILEAADRADIPVYRGVGKPLNYDEPFYAPHVHGDDGIGNINAPLPTTKIQPNHAVLEIMDRVMKAPGELSLMVLGRAPNVALAIMLEPRLAESMKEVIVMGGALRQPGNVSPVATANIWGDPEAADLLYRSGANIAQIGLDVCSQCEISAEQQQQVWDTDTKASRFLEGMTKYIQQAYRESNRLEESGGVNYSDVPAMAYAIAPELFELRDFHVRVETKGSLTRGQTVADFRPRTTTRNPGLTPEESNVRVAMGVNAHGLTNLWTERVCSLGT